MQVVSRQGEVLYRPDREKTKNPMTGCDTEVEHVGDNATALAKRNAPRRQWSMTQWLVSARVPVKMAPNETNTLSRPESTETETRQKLYISAKKQQQTT